MKKDLEELIVNWENSGFDSLKKVDHFRNNDNINEYTLRISQKKYIEIDNYKELIEFENYFITRKQSSEMDSSPGDIFELKKQLKYNDDEFLKKSRIIHNRIHYQYLKDLGFYLKIYLLLGANLGDRTLTLHRAINLIAERVGPVVQQSGLYETAPWGVTAQPTYLNQVLAVETTLEPAAVLIQTQAIEQELGRVRLEKWGARVIDIDILYYDQLVLQTDTLTIPHPYLHQRRFTLVPLAEIAPDFVHPVLRKTTLELLAECEDVGEVTIFNSQPIPPHL